MSDPYSAEKAQSEALDRSFGFDTAKTEAEIAARLARESATPDQTWNHLSPQVFQTPYAELERMIEEADPHRTIAAWADLGAAYGRLGIVLAKQRPTARFHGIELVPERVREGRRIYSTLGLDPASLVEGDLTTNPLPTADLYFIYDFGNREAIDQVLASLQNLATNQAIVVVGRGRGIRDAIERRHPWLGEIVPPFHTDHYSIYRSELG